MNNPKINELLKELTENTSHILNIQSDFENLEKDHITKLYKEISGINNTLKCIHKSVSLKSSKVKKTAPSLEIGINERANNSLDLVGDYARDEDEEGGMQPPSDIEDGLEEPSTDAVIIESDSDLDDMIMASEEVGGATQGGGAGDSAEQSMMISDDDNILEAESSTITADITIQAKKECEEITNVDVDKKYLKVLKKYFGYSNFRPLQWRIIDAVLNNKKDNCVVMSTGYGKSLCYQFSSIYTNRVTIVISPLISLMEDQVMGLQSANVSACFLGSAQKDKNVKQECIEGKYRIVYMTPEFIVNSHNFLKSVHNGIGIDLIAVDEAHCVSQWGHDFRSAYRSIGDIRSELFDIPMMALTATATSVVMGDMCRSLKLRKPVVTCSSYDRPNLYLTVKCKSGNVARDLGCHMITDHGGHSSFPGSTIIYCQTKKVSEEIASLLSNMKISASSYHAGLALDVRKKVHRRFINDKIQVVVATMAFGMGIDKPDVRTIIHYGAPKDIESYYQEIGRAGRDGLDSQCHVIYAGTDFSVNRYFLNDIRDDTYYQHKNDMLVKMQDYLSLRSCRRRFILEHFTSKNSQTKNKEHPKDRCCDNCTQLKLEGKSVVDEVDYGTEIFEMLNAISKLGQKFGLVVPIYFLRGSNNKRLPVDYRENHKFGCGKHKSELWWKALGRMLIVSRYLMEQPNSSGFGSIIEISSKGTYYLDKCRQTNSARPLLLIPSKELLQLEKPKTSAVPASVTPNKAMLLGNTDWLSGDGADAAAETSAMVTTTQTDRKPAKKAEVKTLTPEERKIQLNLYNELIELRDTISSRNDLLSYQVFNNKVISEFAKFRPIDSDHLMEIEDVSTEKAAKYGQEFIAKIKEYSQIHSLSTNEKKNKPQKVETVQKVEGKEQPKVDLGEVLLNLKPAVKDCYEKFQRDKMSIENINKTRERQIKETSLIGYLVSAYLTGLPLDIQRLGVDDKVLNVVLEVIRRPPINNDISMKSNIKNELPEDIAYHQMALSIQYFMRQFGINNEGILNESSKRGEKREAELSWESISKRQKKA